MHQNASFTPKNIFFWVRAQPPPQTSPPVGRGHPLLTPTPLDAFGASTLCPLRINSGNATVYLYIFTTEYDNALSLSLCVTIPYILRGEERGKVHVHEDSIRRLQP